MKLANRRSPRWAFMERFEVPDYDHPERNYLTRWRIIQTPWFGLYLHRLDGPDPRPEPHDHPWPFVSLILRGGYDEVFADPTDDPTQDLGAGIPVIGRRSWRAGTIHTMRARHAHTITRLHRPRTWTLLVVGARSRTWGYWDENGWTPFDEHPNNALFDAAMAARKAHRAR